MSACPLPQTVVLTGLDSWIEVSSQPSSSLSSSVHAQPARQSEERPSRRSQVDSQPQAEQPRSTSVAGSSQDEYEESSSESDPILGSSSEDIVREEDDDDRTALGARPAESVFTPPINAFSHPPSTRRQSDTYFTRPNSTPSSAIRTDRSQRPRLHSHRDRATTGSFQPDHDAALRASLTTLLSCAAAVRPKDQKITERTTARPSTQPTALQLVPESHIGQPRSPKPVKRRSRESSKERHAKKLKSMKTATSNEETMNPTLTAWMISAGVVLVFSAISFSAGYAWGKEVGRLEGELGVPGASCGQEAMRGPGSGLRKIRWSSGNSSIRA